MNHEKIIVVNPSNNFEVIAEFNASTTQEIDSKVQLARDSFVIWAKQSLQERIHILQAVLTRFDHRKTEIAELIAREMGMPISVCMKIDIEVGLLYMKGYLENSSAWLKPEVVYEDVDTIHIMHFEPFGVVAISIPWNYPFTNFIWAVISQLIVGNVVIIKHSEFCVLVTKLFEEILTECHIPQGICNFVYGKGDVGNYLIHSNVDSIWFVGSTNTGQIVYQAAAQKGIPVLLELGGSAPGIIYPDVNIDEVISSIYFYRFINSGQTCDGLKRLIVHSSIFNEVVEKLKRYLQTKKIGSALDITTDIGPLVNQKQVATIKAQVADAVQKGARIIIGGQSAQNLQGAYFNPTIITNISRDMNIWTEEVFGPVLPIISFETDQEAIDLANDNIYGLGGYIFSKNIDRAYNVAQALQTGNVSINNTDYVIPQDPFGGYKKSGIGKIHGMLGIRSLCAVKVIACNKPKNNASDLLSI